MPSIISLASLTRSRYKTLRENFKCANTHLAEYIRRYAFSHQKDGLFQTYFFVDDEDNYLGYISVSVATIERQVAEGAIDISPAITYSIPAIKITRLCTFDTHCSKGVGSILMTFANVLAIIQQKSVGCRAIIVDSKPEAIEFYKKFDFAEINTEEDSDTMFMVHDLLKPSDLKDLIPIMIEFCETYQQTEYIDILSSLIDEDS